MVTVLQVASFAATTGLLTHDPCPVIDEASEVGHFITTQDGHGWLQPPDAVHSVVAESTGP